jgi:hypothetical protein
MNCLEFRRLLAAAPHSRGPEFLSHRDGCPQCAEAAQRADGFEHILARALAVPVPEGLSDRILLRQTTQSRREKRPWQRSAPLWRIAAGVVLALGVGALGYRTWRASDIAELAIAHLPHEPYALTAHAQVEEQKVRAAFIKYGVVLARAPAQVDYVQNCRVGNNHAVHMVMQREEGPVTVMYFADRHERTERRFERGSLMGRAVPMGQGTLVLLASHDQSFDSIERTWRESLMGSALAAGQI